MTWLGNWGRDRTKTAPTSIQDVEQGRLAAPVASWTRWLSLATAIVLSLVDFLIVHSASRATQANGAFEVFTILTTTLAAGAAFAGFVVPVDRWRAVLMAVVSGYLVGLSAISIGGEFIVFIPLAVAGFVAAGRLSWISRSWAAAMLSGAGSVLGFLAYYWPLVRVFRVFQG